MTKPTIHGNRGTLTASIIRAAIAQDLSQIKHEDGLTFADIGRILGKSEDQAAKYCDGTACMDAVTYSFARDEWNGRFTGTLDALIEARKPQGATDRQKLSAILGCAQEVALALEDDDQVCSNDVRKARRKLEAGREAIDELLRKLTVRAA